MRPRFAAAISLLAATSLVALPSVASARPIHNRGITIATTPNPITAGEGVLIYGEMRGVNNGNQSVQLYQHVIGTHGFTQVGTTTTNAQGFYEFPNSAGTVTTDTAWYVRSAGFIHSRTVLEHVQAAVTLSESASSATTGEAVTFSGTVSPNHAGEQVLLQKENDSGGWGTVATATLDSSSSFSVPRAFARENVYTLRALVRRDGRNDRGLSDAITLNVQQKQVPDFTITSSSPIISEGGSTTISGVLDQPGSTVVEPNTEVTLFGRAHGGPDMAIATTTTAADGSYSFPPQTPTTNTAYRVVTTLAPRRSTAVLFEGVMDTISMTASPTTVAAGEPVTFSGTISPNKAGQLVYLQRLGPNGHWLIVGLHFINPDGSYSFTRVFGHQGTAQFRTRVFADGYNIGAASAPATITVSGLPPASSLPPAPAN